MDSSEVIMVPSQEWERLKQLEADLPGLLESAKKQERLDALRRLHQRDKENPEAHRLRSKRRYELKGDAIRTKRREAYRRKKEVAREATTAVQIESSTIS